MSTPKNRAIRAINNSFAFVSRRKLVLTSLAVASAACLVPSARAVDIRIVGQPVRVTASVNSTASTPITVGFTVTTNGLTTLDGTGTNWVCDPVTYSATCPASPSGLSFTYTDVNTNVVTPSFTPVIPTNQGSITITNLLWVNTVSVPVGTYGFSVDATCGPTTPGTGMVLLTVQSAYIWSGAGTTNNTIVWSAATNWVGGNVPGAGAEVVFNDGGGAAGGDTNWNVRVSANTTIGSFRHAITAGATRRHNILLDPGVTLTVNGTNGFTAGMRDRSDTSQEWQLAFGGTNSTLVVSNSAANVSTFSIANQNSTLDMLRLDKFVADVYQLTISDCRAYPNWTNMQANQYGTGGLLQAMPQGVVNFARTNIIKCGFGGDSESWTNPALRTYSLVIGRNNNQGTTQRRNVTLGMSNYFALNSICLAGFGVAMDQTAGRLIFNTAFTNGYAPTAVFRGANGTDRVSMFCIADYATPGSAGSSTKAIIDFTGGTVDAWVDKLWIARERTNNSGSGYARGELMVGRGTFDCNDFILGFQGTGNNSGQSEDYAQGILRVSNGGVFRVNNGMDLGYTTADATNNSGAAATGYGQVYVSDGGILGANLVRVGGVTKLSANNFINITGGEFVCTNTIAAPDKWLTTLAMNGNATLTLFVDGTVTTPYVYVTNVTATGTGNRIRIAQLNNMSTFPVEIPLVEFVGTAPSISASLPIGYVGTLVTSPSNTINLIVSTHTPLNLLWRGASGTWDSSALNWLDQSTSMMTNFTDGDFVTFDDTPGYATSISVAAQVIPSGITVSNSPGRNYVIGGSTPILGSATLTKQGTGPLQFDATSTLALQIDQGSLTGSGSVASLSLVTNTTANFTGTISGGMNCAGAATISGNNGGVLSIESPSGAVTNLGTWTGNVAFESGTVLMNSGTLSSVGTVTVVSNATFINSGPVGAPSVVGSMIVQGVFKDMGLNPLTLDQLTIRGGGKFYVGGDSIGTTTVASTGNGTTPGRVSLNAGSTNYFKVNAGTGETTKLLSLRIDFGPNQAFPQVNGCTIAIQNVGTAFTAGQTFRPFENVFGFDQPLGDSGLNTTNSYPFIEPNTPGTGLGWDVVNIQPPGIGGTTLGGYISTFALNTARTNLNMSRAFGSMIVTNVEGGVTNLVTNAVIFSTLTWPEDHVGWRLQQQIHEGMAEGIGTNWTTLWGSWWTNQMVLTNNILTNGNSVFYRMVFP